MSDSKPLSRLPEGTPPAGSSSSPFHSRYDDSGNRKTTSTVTFTYNGSGQLASCTSGCGTVAHDTAGRTQKLNGWFYEYDAQGRLIRACQSTSCTGSVTKVEFSYDGQGHRTQLKEYTTGTLTRTTDFRYQGDAIVEEKLTDAAHPAPGTVVRSYVVDDEGSIVRMTIPSGEPGAGTYLVTWNGHGDALALWQINAGTGALTLANSYTYTTWGQPSTATHNGIADLGFRFLYVGEFDVQWDNASSLGLLYMHARHYSPALGRFLQPDPDGSEANLYAYTANNPVTELDPDGTCFIILCIAVGVVLFGGLGAAFGTATYATTTPRDDWRADDAAGAAAGGFVEGGAYAIPGGVAGVLAKALTKVPKAARVLRALRPVAPVVRRGGETAAAARGRAAHEALNARIEAKGGGWVYEPQLVGRSGRTLKPDVMTPRGRLLEFKPATASGRAAGRRQAELYRNELGLRGRVIYYDP